ncbi:FtsX-like permease family protein [Streptomyces alkaliterrae]|uniref:FtsX-like permease family protein n=1 Tax=Streptomyces alkaliterrae TaxID=2213162 RepID=A0A5P0YVA5_9ACTN|nr:FtsX-like permease family protein [Streptomyces alkaliterrae]MBB1260989.1 FtsX-like permease family protein [Streptomyces alkaliterrae]MQS03900.1 FtsX-like permease family protein [Streptomyces alkaliterrae]
MRATLRWAHADLRTHRGEALFLVLATTGVVIALLLASALFGYAANPWQRVFTQTNGAHVWIHARGDADPADLERLRDLDGVTAATGPHRTAHITARTDAARADVELRAADADPGPTARPQVVRGRWLDTGTPDGVVLQAGLARALWAEPGDTVTVPGGAEGPRELTVLGIADTAERDHRAGDRPGVGWVLPGALDRVTAPADRLGQVVGLRLADPDDTGYAVQRAVTLLGADGVTEVSDWKQARAEAQSDDRLLGLLLVTFGLGALLAAALAVAGAISTRVRGHLRDISVLKAVGFTPGQVVRIFLVQHVAFALLGAALAVALLGTLGGRFPGRIGEAVSIWRDLPHHTAATLAVPAAAVLFIGLATSLAAWRAGRVPPVPVARGAVPPAAGMSRAARAALGRRVPPALVLGWRAAFARRGRSLTAVARLALPLLLITVALSAWTTLDRVPSSAGDAGPAATLSARATEGLDERQAARLLADNPDVTAVYPGIEVAALAPGQTGTINLRGLGTDARPYPFTVVEGRAPSPSATDDEAVAGQGLLDLLDLEVGDWVRLTVEGHPQILHIVGRTIETEQGGRVVTTSLDTLAERDPGLRPAFHQVQLRPGADPKAVGAALSRASDGRLEIHEVGGLNEGRAVMRGVLAGLAAVLALIGLTELLTTISAGVRDRERDLLALKAIGLTPRQISGVIVTATGLTALAAALTGTLLGTLVGRWLINEHGRASGIGAGIAQSPSTAVLLLLIAGATAGAVAASLLPAARAARRRPADTLAAVV